MNSISLTSDTEGGERDSAKLVAPTGAASVDIPLASPVLPAYNEAAIIGTHLDSDLRRGAVGLVGSP
jgi:hypothetical protein